MTPNTDLNLDGVRVYLHTVTASIDVRERDNNKTLSLFVCRISDSFALGVIWQRGRIRLWDLSLIVSMTPWKRKSKNNIRLSAKVS